MNYGTISKPESMAIKKLHVISYKFDKGGLHIDDKNVWTLNKPMASLSTCHLELVVWDGNLVKS